MFSTKINNHVINLLLLYFCFVLRIIPIRMLFCSQYSCIRYTYDSVCMHRCVGVFCIFVSLYEMSWVACLSTRFFFLVLIFLFAYLTWFSINSFYCDLNLILLNFFLFVCFVFWMHTIIDDDGNDVDDHDDGGDNDVDDDRVPFHTDLCVLIFG